jgi:hypothetical protein
MAKTYKLERNRMLGGWSWHCKDASTGGSAQNKSDAKADAEKHCGKSNIVVNPPFVDATVYRGYLASFTAMTLDEVPVTYSSSEISESEFSYYYGLPCANSELLTDTQKIVTILKIWGLYRGGFTIEEIKKTHNIPDPIFKKLIRRKYFSGSITIEEKGEIIWNI